MRKHKDTPKYGTSLLRYRLDLINEVDIGYLGLGTAMPHTLGSSVLEIYAKRAASAALLNKNPQYKHELLSELYYELGVAQHADNPVDAAHNFILSIKHGEREKPSTPHHEVNRRARVQMAGLMLSRTGVSERRHGLQQRATVRSLGSLVVNGAAIARELPRREQSELFGTLVEVAFLGTCLAYAAEDTHTLGLPTTRRQDSPRTRSQIGYNQAIAGIQQIEATDMNLYEYAGDMQAFHRATRVQIKARQVSEDSKYTDDILMLFGNRDLFIDSLSELHAYGDSLHNSRTITRPVEIAFSNINLALELHHQADLA